MKKYNCLLNLRQLKEEFILDLLATFSKLPHDRLKEKWDFINGREFNDWIRVRKYDDDHSSKITDYYKGLEKKFKNLSTLKWEILQTGEVEYYLIDKVEHMILNKGDFASVSRMLESFHRGTKRLRSNVGGDDNYYIWSERGGVEYPRHEKNLPRGHFRWNYDKRYILHWDSISKLDKFLNDNVL